MNDLAEFLMARIADDEAVARYVRRGPDWAVAEQRPQQWGANDDDFEVIGGGKPVARCHAEYGGYFVAEHIVRWDPARVLAECEAKRRIVAEWQQFWDSTSNDPVMGGWEGGLELAMKALALPYADHPDYREEWRPWQP